MRAASQRVLRVGVAACLTSTSAALSREKPRVPLASTISQKFVPTTVFVHGLDSSKETWTETLAAMHAAGKPCLALDLRGHGESELGSEADFSTDALARDVVEAVEKAGVARPWILVGHSMGGRVAMEVAKIAATDEGLLRAVVVEDMDCKPRSAWLPETPELPDFDRSFATLADAKEALRPFYDSGRIDSWVGKRLRETGDGTWWSDINPRARSLAKTRVLCSRDGTDAWSCLSAEAKLPFEVHLWVAGSEGTVCDWDGDDGIDDLALRLPTAFVKEYKTAAHSIHNTAPEEYMAELFAIIDRATPK